MSRHIHLATCFPLDQTLKGTVPFDIHVQMHMNPGTLTSVDLQVFGDGVDVAQIAAKPKVICPVAQCDYWYHLDYDTTQVPADGSLEFRFHAKVTSPDGSLGYTSSGWQAVLANGGRPVQSYRPAAYLEARGWYEGTEYENARFVTPLPSGPVKGAWTFGVSLAPGSGGTAVNHVLVSVDPHFHNVPVDRGIVVFEKAGPYVGSITIDTTKLSNGVHRLFMRTDSNVAAGTGSGILAFNFRVDNPGTALLAPLTLANDVVQTSLPVLPSLIVLVFLAMIMPRRSARRRAAAVASDRAATSRSAVEVPIAPVQMMVGGFDGGMVEPEPVVMPTVVAQAVVAPAVAPVVIRPVAVVTGPRRASGVEPATPPLVAGPASVAVPAPVAPPVTPPVIAEPAKEVVPLSPVIEPVTAVAAEPVPAPPARPVPATREEAWTEYRRATAAATSPEAVAAATLEWVRAVDRIKRAKAAEEAVRWAALPRYPGSARWRLGSLGRLVAGAPRRPCQPPAGERADERKQQGDRRNRLTRRGDLQRGRPTSDQERPQPRASPGGGRDDERRPGEERRGDAGVVPARSRVDHRDGDAGKRCERHQDQVTGSDHEHMVALRLSVDQWTAAVRGSGSPAHHRPISSYFSID